MPASERSKKKIIYDKEQSRKGYENRVAKRKNKLLMEKKEDVLEKKQYVVEKKEYVVEKKEYEKRWTQFELEKAKELFLREKTKKKLNAFEDQLVKKIKKPEHPLVGPLWRTYRSLKKDSVIKKDNKKKDINRRQDVVVHKLIFKVTRNNIFITVMDPLGRYVFYSSGGLDYFFLRKRTVAVANILLGENLGVELRSKFIQALDLEFHGLPFKSHRLSLIKGLVSSKIFIRDIIDKTPISHNGCDRRKKKRKKFKKRS